MYILNKKWDSNLCNLLFCNLLLGWGLQLLGLGRTSQIPRVSGLKQGGIMVCWRLAGCWNEGLRTLVCTCKRLSKTCSLRCQSSSLAVLCFSNSIHPKTKHLLVLPCVWMMILCLPHPIHLHPAVRSPCAPLPHLNFIVLTETWFRHNLQYTAQILTYWNEYSRLYVLMRTPMWALPRI